MNRGWITGLALAGVAGTSGAAFAGMSVGDDHTAVAEQLMTVTTGTTASTVATDGVVTYQVGQAGVVALTRSGNVLTVTTTTAGAGWQVLGASVPGAHVAVQFADALQVVTFSADVVGGEVVVSVENLPIATVAVPTVLPTVVPTVVPAVVTVPAPAPATAAVTTRAAAAPSSAATTAPSSVSDDDEYEYEDEHEDEYEDEHSEDHEEEHDDD